MRVEFQDGSIGENASVLELSLENLSTLLKSGKYKKSGNPTQRRGLSMSVKSGD